jgi:signal transduction histidine kinase
MRWLSRGVSRGGVSPAPSNDRNPNARLFSEAPGETVHALRVLTATVVLLPVLLFGVAAFLDRSAILRRAEDDGRKTVALLHEQAANLFGGHEIILDTIVERVRGRSWESITSSQDLLRDLEAMDNRLDEVSDILIVDADGAVRATTAHDKASAAMPLVDHDCFLALRDHNPGTCISRPYIDAAIGHSLFSLSRRLEDDGVFRGVAQVAISADYFLDLWGAVVPNRTDTVVLARSDGVVLARYPKLPGRALGLAAEEPLLSGIKKGGEGVISGRSSTDDVDRITVYKKVAGYQAYVGLGIDKNAALGEWYRNLLVYGAVTLAATLALMSAAGTALRRARRERRAVALWRAEVKQRENAQAELVQSQKMESLGQLTGGVAHDFNNLLTVIFGNLEMLERRLTDAEHREYLKDAQEASRLGADLAKRLLAFGRRQSLNPKPVDLNALVKGMADLLRRSLGKMVEIETRLAEGLPMIMVDPGQIENALLNLAINARDAMPQGGRLVIETAGAEIDGDAAAADAEVVPGDYITLSVTDTGAGMTPEVRQRAFEPFYTTKGAGAGSGLGLSMVYGFVKQSGGHIQLDSELGRGTTARLYLPARESDANVTELRAAAPVARAASGETVLVVEDDHRVRRISVNRLEELGYAVLEADSGAAALLMLDRDEPIDLLFTDIVMPGGMTGVDLAHEAAS